MVGAQGLPRAALFTPAVGHSLRFDTRVARSQRLIVEPWVQGSRPGRHNTKIKNRVAVYVCGGRAGTRTLDPLIKRCLWDFFFSVSICH